MNTGENEKMNKFKRIFVIVIDSMGIGNAPDADKFKGDAGADTLGHIAETVEHFHIPHLEKMGIGNLKPMDKVAPAGQPTAYFCPLVEKSAGKDTMTGHWEFMGLETVTPFVTFTDTGFPPELIAELEKRCGKKVIGNKAASGTEILEELAEREINEGDKMIVYTSADSVLQICGNEETFDLQNLYRCCEIARELTMKDEWKVGRVIARPYVGKKKGEFVRTSNRHDYAVKPFGKTALDALKDAGLDVLAVGKIVDIFDGEGITWSEHSKSSVHGMEQTIDIAKRDDWKGLCFVNLVDFDALWGHRRNPVRYGEEIERFDVKLGELLPHIKDDDLVIITADHGNDPTNQAHTDHTREKVPFIAYSPSFHIADASAAALPEQENFGCIGATICDNFGVAMPEGTIGTSVLALLK